MTPDQTAMPLQLEPLDWDAVHAHLPPLEGYTPEEKHFFPRDAQLCYRVHYPENRIILPRGVYSDYAGLLVQGEVQVHDVSPQLDPEATNRPSCWNGFDERRLSTPESRWLARHEWGKPKAVVTENSPAHDRFLGVATTLWNQPRSFTLVAGPKGCTLLLIKRRALTFIVANADKFREEKKTAFRKQELPAILAENRLFGNELYPHDVRAGRLSRLVGLLRGRERSPLPAALRRIREHLRPEFCRALAGFRPDALALREWEQILSELNRLLRLSGLYDARAWRESDLNPEAQQLLEGDLTRLTRSQRIRLNRLLLEAAFTDVFADREPGAWPLHRQDFENLVETLDKELPGALCLYRHVKDPQASGEALLPGSSSGPCVYPQKEDPRGLYFILSGTVRLTRKALGGTVLIRQHDRYGFFGRTLLDQGKSLVNVEAVTDVNLVKLSPAAFERMIELFSPVGVKLRREAERQANRYDNILEVRSRPPDDPPEDFASKLLVTTNLLLIDMELCTRCHRCVVACAEMHQGVPRFHRSNPDLRFGKWEVAGACLHCSDAPCQTACPVGAITFLDNGIVQVHRDRCVSCSFCEPACPFEVIEMLPAPGKEKEAPVASKNKEYAVATKCDRCLVDRSDPPCVSSCPYGASRRGAPLELFPEIKRWEEGLYGRPE
jgi:Fe-S-cluster-containing hydrogenase component 2/CRP-like cAMP-binding protein